MPCPKCQHPTYQPGEPCPNCRFTGDPARQEELSHIQWLLNQADQWIDLGFDEAQLDSLRRHYQARRRDLEIELGLRPPPFTAEEAAAAWPTLFQLETLLTQLGDWLTRGLLEPVASQTLVDQTQTEIDELQPRLEDHPRPNAPQTDEARLETLHFLLEAVEHLRQNNGFLSAEAEARAAEPLRRELAALTASPTPPLPSPPAPAPPPEPVTPTPPPPPLPTPAVPLPERLWRSLLSERTLHAILFMGIFLLFAAALSFVIWGWQEFSPPLRVAIPTTFTAIFFGLGWIVRHKTPLYRSGIALSAIAALLIPIDFYTIYVNFSIPAAYWPAFWLTTSLVSLLAYLLAALAIRSRVFGTLVGVAGGSTMLALVELGHQTLALSLDWRSAALSLLAVGLLGLAYRLDNGSTDRARSFVIPFRALALLIPAGLMPLTFAWRFIDRPGYDTLHTALTVNWWLGGLIFAWGAITFRSRTLGLLAAVSLPVAVYLAQAALFDAWGVNPAWHGLGLALLTPLYLLTARRLLARPDPILHAHGRNAAGWSVALILAATLWSLTDLTSGAAAATTHTVLTAAVILAVVLWQRPVWIFGASLLALSAATFAMTELDLTLPQFSVGWASLAILHLLTGLNLQQRPRFAGPTVTGGYVIAGLALLPPLFPYDGHLLAYALGNWLALTGWGAWLAHQQRAGFTAKSVPQNLFHWLTAIPLPLWLWILFINRRPPDAYLPLALAALAWAMVMLGHRLKLINPAWRYPWHLIGGMVSLAAPAAAFLIAPTGFAPPLTLLAVGLLYLADAVMARQSSELALGGLVTAWGWLLLLDRLHVPFDAAGFGLALLISLYLLTGLWAERRRLSAVSFLGPLYVAAHLLTLMLLWRIYLRPLDRLFSDADWTDAMRLWGASAQLLLGAMYGLYAWGRYKERWGHLAAWLGAAAGGFIAITYSTGRGSSAAKAALIAIIFVLAERALHTLRRHPRLTARRRAVIRLAWPLYRRPLLTAGWTVSAIVIGLALIRNLLILDGGRIQQIWAATGLLLIVGLYGLAARLFRQRRFVWLAALLMFAPWTILTNLGWFTVYRPTLPGFALSWLILAWLTFLTGLLVRRLAGARYARPLFAVANLFTPLALLWAIADVDTSRFTVGLAVGLYGLSAWLDHRRQTSALKATRFLYPALILIPVWAVYLLAWLLPAARHEHFGLMLWLFGPLGLAAGQWLERRANAPRLAPAYGRPAYLTAYGAVIVATMLTAHIAGLLALMLLLDALLLTASARLFRNPLWTYPAAALVPLSLLISLHEAGVPANRQGWWLIGLGAVYLTLSALLRRIKQPAYAGAALAVGFAVVALGLPPSSRDQTGALWGYGGAALLYALSAAWLRQPLLLTPAAALALVPYAIGLQKSSLLPEWYGLALYPGAVVALALGWGLDRRLGTYTDFPWQSPARWPAALAARLTGWWGLPLYGLGFGLAAASPLFTEFRSDLTALNFLLMMPLFGWAIARFQRRGWLLALAAAGHLAMIYNLDFLGWWRYPEWAWLRFMPVTVATAGAALLIAWRRGEGSPLGWRRWWPGWSRPLYGLVLLDIVAAQLTSLSDTGAGALVTLSHGLLLAVLASAWGQGLPVYVALLLGLVSLTQWNAAGKLIAEGWPVRLAQLALGYGVMGYGLAVGRLRLDKSRQLRPWAAIWELPLQRVSIGLSFIIMLLAGWLGLDLAGWTIRAMFGLHFRQIVELPTVQMAVGVLSLLGLLYVAAAVAHRWLRLGYVALAMLLAGWMLHAFYIQQWDRLARVQWYAIPAGLYLLGVGWLEWQRGHKTLARWLDYTSMLLMLGSLFWQTMLFGWGYALLLGVEGVLAFWWGSGRRLRRFFYAGIVAVMLATLGQLINSLRSVNQWIVFGIIGLLLVLVAIFVERKLEDIKAWQDKIMETWE